jgi:uncharacterized protein YkwD
MQEDYTRPTTRADFCMLAVLVYESIIQEEIIEHMTFEDTDDINAQKMGGLGVVTGVGKNMFAPDKRITREQAAVMVARMMYSLGIVIEEEIGEETEREAFEFADSDYISSWAVEAIGQVRAAGIMTGNCDGFFMPREHFTIEQSIITLLRLYDLAMEHNEELTSIYHEYAVEMLRLINAERVRAGVGELTTTPLLYAAAMVRAVELEVRYSHTRPDGRGFHTALRDLGIVYRSAGENAFGGRNLTPQAAFNGWMNSQGHRENMLNPMFSQAGVAVHISCSGRLYWALLLIV